MRFHIVVIKRPAMVIFVCPTLLGVAHDAISQWRSFEKKSLDCLV